MQSQMRRLFYLVEKINSPLQKIGQCTKAEVSSCKEQIYHMVETGNCFSELGEEDSQTVEDDTGDESLGKLPADNTDLGDVESSGCCVCLGGVEKLGFKLCITCADRVQLCAGFFHLKGGCG